MEPLSPSSQLLLERDGGGADGTGAGWAVAARLLARKAGRVDATTVLALLPDGVPLGRALTFVEGALRGARTAARGGAVERALRRADNLAAREEVARLKARSVMVAAERACCLCTRRLGGGGAVVALPPAAGYGQGAPRQLAHYSCHARRQAGGGGGRGEGGEGGGEGVAGVGTGSGGVPVPLPPPVPLPVRARVGP